jgi:hypothetical protein
MVDNWYVEIVAYEGDEVVKSMGPMSERRAEKVERGALINNNHDEFYIQIRQRESGEE